MHGPLHLLPEHPFPFESWLHCSSLRWNCGRRSLTTGLEPLDQLWCYTAEAMCLACILQSPLFFDEAKTFKSTHSDAVPHLERQRSALSWLSAHSCGGLTTKSPACRFLGWRKAWITKVRCLIPWTVGIKAIQKYKRKSLLIILRWRSRTDGCQ